MDESGSSVSLSADGSVVAIGAPLHYRNHRNLSESKGQVRIFEYDSVNWQQRGNDIEGGFFDRTQVNL